MKPNEDQINDVLDKCLEAETSGSIYPGMTYEQGVSDAIRWMLGEGECPFDDF